MLLLIYAPVIIKYYGHQCGHKKKPSKPSVSRARTQSRQVTALLLLDLLQRHIVWFGIQWAKETIALDECQKQAKHTLLDWQHLKRRRESMSVLLNTSVHTIAPLFGVCMFVSAPCVLVLYAFMTSAVFLNYLWRKNRIATRIYARSSPWATDSKMSNEAGLWTQVWFTLYWISKACTHLLEQECSHLWHSLEGS